MPDIVPDLLTQIEFKFNEQISASKTIASVQSKIAKGTATYADAQAYSIEVGEILAKVFGEYITGDALPDGRMYYNIAERILNATLGKNHSLISHATKQIQELLNAQAGLGLKAAEVPLYKNKVTSLINRITKGEFDDVAWLLDAPIVTFSQNIVDEMLKANVQFHAKSGLKATVTRTVHGHKPCDWCRQLEGTYTYPDVPREVYTRHDRCKCTVEYTPGDKRRQNVWSKDWLTDEEKEQIELRKQYGV